jgi:hypothetical protein
MSEAEIETLLRPIWGNVTPIAEAIASCESGWNPSQIGTASQDGIPDYGLFQLHGIEIMDAYQNALYAYQQKYLPALARGDGWSPWLSSRHCWLTKI